MTSRAVTLILCALGWAVGALAQNGMPFIRNFMADEYHAHNRNFDIVAGDNGMLYVANFEGLLYYDNAEWRILHTPGITRITDIFKDSDGTIWTGGYNYIGQVGVAPNGSPRLEPIGQQVSFKGAVTNIWEEYGKIFFLVDEQTVYAIEGNRLVLQQKKNMPQEKSIVYSDRRVVTQVLPLSGGLQAVATNGSGIVITDIRDNTLYTITEANGLCSDNVAHIAFDGNGHLWGATDNGLFCIDIPSVYTRYTEREGLRGEVLAIEKFHGHHYVGTLSGLYRREGMTFVPVSDISHACYALATMDGKMLAATTDGVYCLQADGMVRQLTNISTMSLFVKGNTFYSGEMSGLYLNDLAGMRQQVSPEDKVVKIFEDESGTLWLQNLYGEIMMKRRGQNSFSLYTGETTENNAATIVNADGKTMVVSATATTPFPYPRFSFTAHDGTTWLTDNEGKNLYAWKDGKHQQQFDQTLHPISSYAVRSMLVDDDLIWIGGNNGLILVSRSQDDPLTSHKPQLLIHSVVVNGDSVLWGGIGECPASLPSLSREQRNIRFTFALDYTSAIQQAQYRYRVSGGVWSSWSTDNEAVFFNQPGGSYKFEVQARDILGRESDIVSVSYRIAYPFYIRWYMVLLYLLLLFLGFNVFSRWRLKRVEKEKRRLESIVQERTAEVVKQKDEIEEKSKSLETALNELHQAQHELIRQEKMATVGKLTQGLIDRILNPLNYINNFSKLSEGLVKDLEANIADEQERMSEDNYEDTIDVLGMLSGNLQKVSEHGQNTTRTLKAMEEMLKDRTGGIVPMDLASMLRQDKSMLLKYYADDISREHIDTDFDVPDQPLHINGNAEQLSKTVMSLLGNAVYAVVRKAKRQDYRPLISLKVSRQDDTHYAIVIRDNGIGIEESIIDKIFDPFFTTKTTGEASGVGLYLSREIVQNHGGDISVRSVKDNYTEFTILLPALTE